MVAWLMYSGLSLWGRLLYDLFIGAVCYRLTWHNVIDFMMEYQKEGRTLDKSGEVKDYVLFIIDWAE